MFENRILQGLTINSASSSLKFALYDIGRHEKNILSGMMARIALRACQKLEGLS
jgi:acetate kinase